MIEKEEVREIATEIKREREREILLLISLWQDTE